MILLSSFVSASLHSDVKQRTNGQRRPIKQSCEARGLNEKHRAIVQVKQKWHFIGKTLSKIVPAKIKHLYCIYMLLFSNRAKYRIYTFVIKDSMLQEINASHLQKVLIKNSGLLTSLVKPQTFTRSKEQTSIKVGNIQNSTFHTTYKNMVSIGVRLCSLTKETFCHYSQSFGAQRRKVR